MSVKYKEFLQWRHKIREKYNLCRHILLYGTILHNLRKFCQKAPKCKESRRGTWEISMSFNFLSHFSPTGMSHKIQVKGKALMPTLSPSSSLQTFKYRLENLWMCAFAAVEGERDLASTFWCFAPFYSHQNFKLAF